MIVLQEDDVSDFQRNETHEDQSGSVEDHSKVLYVFHLLFPFSGKHVSLGYIFSPNGTNG